MQENQNPKVQAPLSGEQHKQHSFENATRQNADTTQTSPQRPIPKAPPTKKQETKNNAWEEASIEDLESGEFEII